MDPILIHSKVVFEDTFHYRLISDFSVIFFSLIEINSIDGQTKTTLFKIDPFFFQSKKRKSWYYVSQYQNILINVLEFIGIIQSFPELSTYCFKDNTLHQQKCNRNNGLMLSYCPRNVVCKSCLAPMDIKWNPNLNENGYKNYLIWHMWSQKNCFLFWIPEELLDDFMTM